MRKEVKDAVKKRLDVDMQNVKTQIARNKWAIRDLAAKQALLKRERGVLQDLIKVVS